MNSINTYKRGVLTIAVGNLDFVEMAVDMALSYKLFNSEPISCIVDSDSLLLIKSKYFSIFDKLIILPAEYNNGRVRKFSCAKLTPYESTMYIDSDILLLSNISYLWDEAEENESITMIGDYLDFETSVIHHGFPVKELIQKAKIARYLKTNSGFFHLFKENAIEYFDECKKKFIELSKDDGYIKKGWLGDEIAIGIVSHNFNVDCFKLPSPMLWDKELVKLKKIENTKALCHFIAPIPPKTVALLSKRANRLRIENNIPLNETKIWEKLNNRRLYFQKRSFFDQAINKVKIFLKKFIILE